MAVNSTCVSKMKVNDVISVRSLLVHNVQQVHVDSFILRVSSVRRSVRRAISLLILLVCAIPRITRDVDAMMIPKYIRYTRSIKALNPSGFSDVLERLDMKCASYNSMLLFTNKIGWDQEQIRNQKLRNGNDNTDFRPTTNSYKQSQRIGSSHPRIISSNNTSSASRKHSQLSPNEGEYQSDNKSFINREMEQRVMASARATIDRKTLSRAVSSLINDRSKTDKHNTLRLETQTKDDLESKNDFKHNLRYLAGKIQPSLATEKILNDNRYTTESWNSQQIAIASGTTSFLLSPIVVSIIHSFLPPIFPFPSSISFEGAAFIGTLAYILALGDPTDQSNIIAKTSAGSPLEEGVEVTGAVSRIVGRTALQTMQTSAPRLKAVARVVVDYDNMISSLEEMEQQNNLLSKQLLFLKSENKRLRRELALWLAVEDASSAYKMEDLKEMARAKGVKGYSTDAKNALLRKLVKEGNVDLSVDSYYDVLDNSEGKIV